MKPRFYIVDVFSERPYGGNPLAVVVADEWLPDAVMQQIAAEMNFSETAFAASTPEDGAYRVRIFTPAREIAFAGHPILGAAWVLRHHLCKDSPEQVRLVLAVGDLPVAFETEAGREIAWFQAPPIFWVPLAHRSGLPGRSACRPGQLRRTPPSRWYRPVRRP